MSSDFSVEITDKPESNLKVLHLNGELDEVSVENLRTSVDPILEDKSVLKVIFDLSGLQFINSKGIGYLVSVHTHLSKDGRSLVIAGAVAPVMDVISLVGLTSIMPYYPTLEAALNA